MSQLPSEDDIKQLADCFYANVDSPGTDCPELRSKIKHLPRHLRSSRTIDHIFHKRRDGGDLCSIHKGLNSETTSIIFGSLRTELTSTIEHMRQYAFLFGPDESMTLDRVAAIEEMWKENTSTSNTSQNINNSNTTRWRHQADQCEACMLSRIATYPSALRELRTLFLAHRPISPGRPIIHAFVEEWIKLTDQRKSLFEMSSQRAAVMTDAIYEWNSKPRNLEYSHFQESYFGKNQDKPATTTRLPKSRAPVAQRGPGSPIFSSTLSRPLSRNANELSETEFLREFSANKGFHRAPPGDDYPFSYTDIYPRDNNPARTERAQQRQYQDRQGTPDTGPSSTLYSPWSSTDELRGPVHSRFSQSTTSSPSTYSERAVYHTPQPKSSLPNPRTPDRNKLLPPVPNVSPFAVSPPFSRAYSGGSAWSSGEEVVGTTLQMTRMDNRPRLVDVRAAAERGRYIPR